MAEIGGKVRMKRYRKGAEKISWKRSIHWSSRK